MSDVSSVPGALLFGFMFGLLVHHISVLGEEYEECREVNKVYQCKRIYIPKVGEEATQ